MTDDREIRLRATGTENGPSPGAGTSPAGLKITTREGVVVAGITGELDMANAESVGSAIIAGIPADARGLVIDLTPLTFLDSVGIAVIVGIRQILLAREQRLALVTPAASRVSATLRVAGVWEHMQAVETVEAAFSALDRDAPSSDPASTPRRTVRRPGLRRRV